MQVRDLKKGQGGFGNIQDSFLHSGDVPKYPPEECCKSYGNYEISVCQDFMKLYETALEDGVG